MMPLPIILPNMSKEQLTDNDRELIELAESTTYRSSIRKYIEEADTQYCREVLADILNNSDTNWED